MFQVPLPLAANRPALKQIHSRRRQRLMAERFLHFKHVARSLPDVGRELLSE